MSNPKQPQNPIFLHNHQNMIPKSPLMYSPPPKFSTPDSKKYQRLSHGQNKKAHQYHTLTNTNYSPKTQNEDNDNDFIVHSNTEDDEAFIETQARLNKFPSINDIEERVKSNNTPSRTNKSQKSFKPPFLPTKNQHQHQNQKEQEKGNYFEGKKWSECDLREVRSERDSFELNIMQKYGIEDNEYEQDKTSVSDMDPFQKQILKNQKFKSGKNSKNSIIGATELEEETGNGFLDDSDLSLKDLNRKYNLGLSRSRSRSVSKTRSNITRSVSRTRFQNTKISSRNNSRNNTGTRLKTQKKNQSPPKLLETLNFDSLEKQGDNGTKHKETPDHILGTFGKDKNKNEKELEDSSAVFNNLQEKTQEKKQSGIYNLPDLEQQKSEYKRPKIEYFNIQKKIDYDSDRFNLKSRKNDIEKIQKKLNQNEKEDHRNAKTYAISSISGGSQLSNNNNAKNFEKSEVLEELKNSKIAKKFEKPNFQDITLTPTRTSRRYTKRSCTPPPRYKSYYSTLQQPIGMNYKSRYDINQGEISGKLKYIGGMKDLKYHGAGKIMTYSGDIIYEGDFKEGQYDGEGTLKNINFVLTTEQMADIPSEFIIRYLSLAKNNNYISNLSGVKGLLTINHSEREWTEYKGFFKNGLKDGVGHLKLNDGREYEGEFQEGYAHGYGILTNMGNKVFGQWKKNTLVQFL